MQAFSGACPMPDPELKVLRSSDLVGSQRFSSRVSVEQSLRRPEKDWRQLM